MVFIVSHILGGGGGEGGGGWGVGGGAHRDCFVLQLSKVAIFHHTSFLDSIKNGITD